MRAMCLAALVCVLTGCAAGMPQVSNLAPSSAAGYVPAAKQGRIFISNTNNNAIAYYDSQPPYKPLGVIKGSPLNFPTGMAVDSKGNLYVANAGGLVLVYPPSLNAPSRTLPDPGYFTNAVAVGADGTIYAANLFKEEAGSKQGPGNVVVYAPGSSKPAKTLTDSNFFYVTGVALDGTGNLFVSYDEGTNHDPTQTGRVAEFPAGSSKPKEIISAPGPKGNSGVTAIALDAKSDIVIAAFGPDTFDVYPPGKSMPSRSFSGGKNGISEGIAFDASGQTLYSSELASKLADVFDYATGKQIGTIKNSSTSQYGIAVSPSL